MASVNRKSAQALTMGKGKGKLLDDEREVANYREPAEVVEGSKVKFPGAIKKNKHVMAVMRDNKTWCIAKIMEIRRDPSQPPAETQSAAIPKYEYYVTYLDHERRNDRWIPEICLRIDEEAVSKELNRIDDAKKVKEEGAKEFMANDVHHGMA